MWASEAGITNGRTVDAFVAFSGLCAVTACTIPIVVTAVGVQGTDGLLTNLRFSTSRPVLFSQARLCDFGILGFAFPSILTGIVHAWVGLLGECTCFSDKAVRACAAFGSIGITGTNTLILTRVW